MSAKDNKLRTFDKIPIFIVENHNEVLEFVYRCLGSRHLPFSNNTMIHFDSHPDMTVSRSMPSEYVFNKEKLLAEVSIENWIMPTCFAGHLSQLVWMKPYWATQIKDNDYQFVIGDYCGNIRVNSTLEYFLSEASYRPESELSKNKLIDLKVRTLSNDFVGHSDLLPSDNEVYMLDIDLDFFSTHNPFLKIYEKADAYTKLHPIFAFSWPDKLDETDELLAKVKDRENQLNELEKVFQYVADNGHLTGITVPEILKSVWSQINELVADVQANYSDVNWTLIYDAGCTCDTTDLPHHESPLEEINMLIDQFKQFLRGLQLPPTIVTISRSSYDDYCPVDQVEHIQEKVLNALQEVYGDRISNKPILDYKDEEWKI
ncbi:hypothetical protein HA402_007075 [Bradysia odoriphaga]|nr:hypothetical protein HA402_007075 [Bradysia odoriphaga]